MKIELPFEKGATLTPAKLAEAQKALYESHLFQEVRVEAIATNIPDSYDVSIALKETGKYQFSYSAGYNSEKSIEGAIQITDWNLLGKGQPISFLSKVNADDKIFRIVYHVPDAVGLKWRMMIDGRVRGVGAAVAFHRNYRHSVAAAVFFAWADGPGGRLSF